MPIAEVGFIKEAGVPCDKLCDKGCSIFNELELPNVCRTFFCEWRMAPFLDKKPDYRPDRLGVIFNVGRRQIALWETRSGALEQQSVRYILSRIKRLFPRLLIAEHVYGAWHGFVPQLGRYGRPGEMNISKNELDLEVVSPDHRIVRRVSLAVI